MSRTFHIIFLGLVISITANAQKQNDDNKVLKIHSLIVSEYPILSARLEYTSFTKPFSNDSLIVLEDGLKTKVINIDLIKTNTRLKLLFFLVNIDSSKTRQYIKKLSLFDQPSINSRVILYNDSAIVVVPPAEWLKNSNRWRGMCDSVGFYKLSDLYLGLLHKPTEVVIILTKEINLNFAKSVKNKIQNKTNINPPNLLLLYQDARPEEIESLNEWASQQDIGVVRFSPEKNDYSSLKPYFESIQNSRYTLYWKSSVPLYLNPTRSLQISMNGNTDKIKITVPDTIINKYFTTQTIKTADSLFLNKDLKACLKVLNNGYGSLKSPDFIQKSKEILENQLIQLAENKGKISLSSFLDLESVNNLPLGQDYLQFKFKQIIELYNLVDKADTLGEEQLRIADFLLKAAPNEAVNKYNMHWARAKFTNSKGNKWQALDEYKLAYDIKKEEKARGEVTRLINICLNEAYQSKDWKRLNLYGKNYSDFIKPSFNLNFFYARACFELSDYEEAISQFKWLLFNWEENNNITWNDAFNYLQNAYTNSSQFNEAVILCQRIFFEKKDSKSLDLTLLNIRLSWLKPVMDAFNLWLEKIPAEAQPEKSIILKRVTFPQFIGSVRVSGSKGEPLAMLFENKTFPKQPSNTPIFGKKTNSVLIENNLQWFVSGLVGNRSIAMSIDNTKIEEQEKNLLTAIRKEPTNNQVWAQLLSYEGKIGARLLSQLYAAIISSSIQMNGVQVTNSFGDVLKGSKYVQYIVYQKRDGSVGYSTGFDRKRADYKGDNWEKSSKTTSLYVLETKYENADIYEITNPVFNGTSWEGVFRIGIKNN